MEPSPRKLRLGSFALHAARGLVRDQTMRRRAMFFATVAAMVMVFVGATLLQPWLVPREHPLGFFLFWIACGWVTFTALLLAVFDMLMVRLQARRERRRLKQLLGDE